MKHITEIRRNFDEEYYVVGYRINDRGRQEGSETFYQHYGADSAAAIRAARKLYNEKGGVLRLARSDWQEHVNRTDRDAGRMLDAYRHPNNRLESDRDYAMRNPPDRT